jgi:hypothetical protein
MRNLRKFNYAGTHLGVIRVTDEFGQPMGEIEYTKDTDCWTFTPEGQSPFPPAYSAADLMKHINQFQEANG